MSWTIKIYTFSGARSTAGRLENGLRSFLGKIRFRIKNTYTKWRTWKFIFWNYWCQLSLGNTLCIPTKAFTSMNPAAEKRTPPTHPKNGFYFLDESLSPPLSMDPSFITVVNNVPCALYLVYNLILSFLPDLWIRLLSTVHSYVKPKIKGVK